MKHILKYLKRMRDYMLVYSNGSLETIGYINSHFQEDIDSRKSTSGYIFTFNGGAICWRSVKQTCVPFVFTFSGGPFVGKVSKKLVWLHLSRKKAI